MNETAQVGPNSVVSFREITEETLLAVCMLSTTLPEPQRRMVATNSMSIAQAHFNPHAWFRAIYADETPVGFIMLYDNPETPRYYLWRFMIGSAYQKFGFGKQAIALLIEHVKTRPGAEELLLSCGEGEGSPEGFYKKMGFERTGEIVDGEVEMGLKLKRAG
jgi:diamine N-acetyltransferase